jgi:prolyl oligopeptidase
MTRIKDPFRWMEEDSPALRSWVEEQHEHAMGQLSSVPSREVIRRRLEELLRTPVQGEFIKAGNRHFFRRRSENQELASLYYQDALTGIPQLLLDPNDDLTVTLADVHPSCDGSFIAYRLSSSGSSSMSLHVMNVDSKEIVDVIPGVVNPVAHAWHTKNRVAWIPDNSGFYYTRCPSGLPQGESRFNHKLYFHRLGDDWQSDNLVFGESLRREQTPYPQLSPDGRYLTVLVQDISGSQLYLLDRENPQHGFVAMTVGVEAFISGTSIHQETLYVQTNHKLISVKLSGIDEVATVILEGPYPLKAWTIVNNLLFVETLEDVSSRLRVYDLAGTFIKEIALPGIGTINALHPDDLSFSFSSFLIPKTVHRIDHKTLPAATSSVGSRSPSPAPSPDNPFDPNKFETKQVWFQSRDKTRVHMFLLHRKDLELDGNSPTVIHAYGGFGVSLVPTFTPHVIPFLETGGIYAVVNARGGGEFGEEWHRAGMRENKQNTFDDIIAAAEWLIAEGYTVSAKLGCFGWSNGGLTVNAVVVQRPDLFKAVVAGSPVTDMVRFHLAHGGKHWIADYGSPEDPNDLESLLTYSPYHTLPEKIAAPAILTIAPDNDDRVAPWHGYKMHASWLAANTSKNPILLRQEKESGHRGHPSLTRTIDRYTDIWSFFLWQLNS